MSLREDEPPEGGVTCGVAVTERTSFQEKSRRVRKLPVRGWAGFLRAGFCAQRGAGQKVRSCCSGLLPPPLCSSPRSAHGVLAPRWARAAAHVQVGAPELAGKVGTRW